MLLGTTVWSRRRLDRRQTRGEEEAEERQRGGRGEAEERERRKEQNTVSQWKGREGEAIRKTGMGKKRGEREQARRGEERRREGTGSQTLSYSLLVFNEGVVMAGRGLSLVHNDSCQLVQLLGGTTLAFLSGCDASSGVRLHVQHQRELGWR